MKNYIISIPEDHINSYEKFPYPKNSKEEILKIVGMHPNEVIYIGRSNNAYHYYYIHSEGLVSFLEKLENSSTRGIDVRIQSTDKGNVPTDLRGTLQKLFMGDDTKIPAAPLP